MTTKLLVFGAVLVAIALLLVWAGKSTNRSGGEPSQVSPPDSVQSSGSPHGRAGLPLPTITHATVAVQSAEGVDLGTVTLEPGTSVPLAGTDYSLRLDGFYTHWNWVGTPVNLSYKEANPAVGISVLRGDTLAYHQWAFQHMPFFRRGKTAGHQGADGGELAFTLLAYKGLKLPKEHPDGVNL